MGNALFVMDTTVILIGAILLKSFTGFLYSVIYTFVCSKAIDIVYTYKKAARVEGRLVIKEDEKTNKSGYYPVKEDVIIGRLKTILEAEGKELNDEVLRLIAGNCNGQVRDAVKNLQQCVYSEVETEEQFNKLFGIPDTAGMRAFIKSTLDKQPKNGLKAIKQLDVDFFDWKCRLEGVLLDMMMAHFNIQPMKLRDAKQAAAFAARVGAQLRVLTVVPQVHEDALVAICGGAPGINCSPAV